MRSPTLARAAVIAILAVSGVVGAFATIAPGPDGQAVPPTTALVETLSIRANDALLPSPASYFREEPFQRGDTLASFLSRLGIEEAQVARLVRLRVLQTLRPGSLVNAEVRAGRVLAAEFVNQGRNYRAVHFGGGYYAPDGKNLRKAFLRSPLEFSRVSSGFGMRMHPFAQSWRAHQGIDYAAPVGTRVRAVGDGVVEFAGVKGGYGNVVFLRHRAQYATPYAHLSRIAAGVHRGAQLAQNDTIGFVGQTGWATGPHLHYEFRIAGQARNPFSIAMPAGLPLPAQDLAGFQYYASPLMARLDLLAESNLAQLE